ncbi:MAG: hypothetical protein E7255_16105 [Lachnospiraceae bacterium]|nr:hypothetical protein [Lachnospiraceae bacterium]
MKYKILIDIRGCRFVRYYVIQCKLTINSNSENESLILSGCRVVLPEKIEYSELDELSYYTLNCNDYDYGRMDIELNFENGFKDPYFKYYVQCVTIRADKKAICKINRNRSREVLKLNNFTKITKEGKLALGISYYFKSLAERSLLLQCNSFCIEVL